MSEHDNRGTESNQQIEAVAATQSTGSGIAASQLEGPWRVSGGRLSAADTKPGFTAQGVEPLDYSNPYSQNVERVWYDGRIVFALDVGRVDIPSAEGVKVAQEYQPVYSVQLDEHGKVTQREEVPGQYNIYDSIPGQEQYSPIWQFNFVIVPRDYTPQTLRSERDCRSSGYPIQRSNVFEN